MNEDNYYWLFSSAAQSIAALIAFLMAGIALAFSMMDRLVEQDETLYEVVEALRRRQHAQLTALAIVTGVAILSSLIAVYLIPYQTVYRTIARTIAASVDIGIIIFSIAFVASIIRPARYSIAAKREYAASQKFVEPAAGQESANVFFRQFIELEQNIRSYLQHEDLYVPVVAFLGCPSHSDNM